MPTLVRFVLNKLTGEIEEFLVDDQNRSLPEAEHDRIALEVGRAIARDPALVEIVPGKPPPRPTPSRPDEPERTPKEPALVRRS